MNVTRSKSILKSLGILSVLSILCFALSGIASISSNQTSKPRPVSTLTSFTENSLPVSATVTAASNPEIVHATVVGSSFRQPTNGTLHIVDNSIALVRTKYVTYYMHDGYFKQTNLDYGANSSLNRGVILKEEDIENNCGPYPLNVGGLNPNGGTNIQCTPALHSTPTFYPINGDLVGRFCRVAPPGFHLPCPIFLKRIESNTGTGHYLTVGGKDHGALQRVDYLLTNGKLVEIFLPPQIEITRIVISPVPVGGNELYQVVLNNF